MTRSDAALRRPHPRPRPQRPARHLHDPPLRRWNTPAGSRGRPARPIACPPRPSGNTPPAPARRPPIRSGTIPAKIGDYAWYVENCEKPQAVGKKKPNPFGLHDMHGNVAEWCLDHYAADRYAQLPTDKPALGPVLLPDALEYSYVARGGSWDDDPEAPPLGRPPLLEQGMERPRPPAPAEHLVAHRRHFRRLPRRPRPGRAGRT